MYLHHRSFGGAGPHITKPLGGEISSHAMVSVAQFRRAVPCEGIGCGCKSRRRPYELQKSKIKEK